MPTENPFYEIKEQQLQVFFSRSMNFPEHLHNHTEIILVMENQLEVNINGVHSILHAGDCAVIFPEQIHSYHSSCANRLQLLIFDNTFAGPFLHTLQECHPSRPILTADILPQDAGLIFERLHALASEKAADFRDNADNTKLLAAAWIQVLLALTMPLLKTEKNKKPENMDLTFRLVSYIMEHFQEPLTLESLAKELHVNKYYLSHTFSNRLHTDFRQYLNRVRLEYAMSAIQSGSRPLTEIWMEAGFNSQRSFNRVFREVNGMTPTEYRQRNQ